MESLVHPAILYTGLALGAVGVALSMPRRKGSFPAIGGLIAAIFFGAIVLTLTVIAGEHRPNLFFYIFAFIALGASLRVITHPRPVYAALYFIMTILSSSALYLLLGAEFLTFALIIIYAGAILITYLFVIMLAAQSPSEEAADVLSDYDADSREPIASAAVGFALLAVLTGLMAVGVPAMRTPDLNRNPDAALDLLPRKVQRAYDTLGITRHALPLMPGRKVEELSDAAAADRDRAAPAPGSPLEPPPASSYWSESRRAVFVITDVEGFNERYHAGVAAQRGESVPRGVRPLRADAMALIVRVFEDEDMSPLVQPTPDWGMLLMEFPDSLRADNIENVGFALLGEHPLAIELAGVILLLALIGAVILARKQIEASEVERLGELGPGGGA